MLAVATLAVGLLPQVRVSWPVFELARPAVVPGPPAESLGSAIAGVAAAALIAATPTTVAALEPELGQYELYPMMLVAKAPSNAPPSPPPSRRHTTTTDNTTFALASTSPPSPPPPSPPPSFRRRRRPHPAIALTPTGRRDRRDRRAQGQARGGGQGRGCPRRVCKRACGGGKGGGGRGGAECAERKGDAAGRGQSGQGGQGRRRQGGTRRSLGCQGGQQ